MKQTEAIEVVRRLLPQMEKEPPEQVLHKYAADAGLAPAQLERLGHVFNTASTLRTLETDREASPYLMDVPKLVRGYVDETGRSKRASWMQEAGTMEKAAAAPAQASKELPAVWRELPNTDLPDFREPPDLSPVRKQAFWEGVKLASRALEDEIDHVSRMSVCIVGMARNLKREEQPQLKFATFKADVEALDGTAETAALVDKLGHELAGLGVSLESRDAQQAPPFVLARDRTGYRRQLAGALDHLKLAGEAREALTLALETVEKMASYFPEDESMRLAAVRLGNDMARLAVAGGLIKEALTAKKSDPASSLTKDPADRRERSADTLEGAVIKPALDSGLPAAQGAVAGANRLIFEGIPGFVRAFQREGDIGALTSGLAERNQGRADDQSARRRQLTEDTMAAANLKRLMITDEELSTKDPEQVFEAFQTIRSASPEVAGDISMLRLLLRQALATQGMDIDTASAARGYEYGKYQKPMPGQLAARARN